MDKFEDIKYKINIRNIKSYFIIKKIFSFLSLRQKLNMIIYNIELQNLLSVDINDYKIISGKQRIIEKNGKGREYIINTNLLIFEGEYLNRKRNGKGKEYYKNGKLRFEGEYINEKRSGKGKEYYEDGKLKFEGEFQKGKIWNGNGKEYFYGKLKFNGEYLNEQRNGKGK